MTFASSWRLAFLVLPVALLVGYLLAQRSRRRAAVRFTSVDLLASVAPRRPAWQRHLPAAAFLLAVVVLVLSFAEPSRIVRTPRQRATVVLTLDTSGSMIATDVSPSRLGAAKQAADSFVRVFAERHPARTCGVFHRRQRARRTHHRPLDCSRRDRRPPGRRWNRHCRSDQPFAEGDQRCPCRERRQEGPRRDRADERRIADDRRGFPLADRVRRPGGFERQGGRGEDQHDRRSAPPTAWWTSKVRRSRCHPILQRWRR